MRVMLARETRLIRTNDGVYSRGGPIKLDRYLQVFSEVIVFARIEEVEHADDNCFCIEEPRIKFFHIPYYLGPSQFLKNYRKLVKAARKAIGRADAYVLRIPGAISTILLQQLIKSKTPYGVEVVGDSMGAIETCGASFILRYILRLIGPEQQKKACRYASAASYITNSYLQNSYPCNCWSIDASNVELTDECFIDQHGLERRLAMFKEASDGKRPFVLAHAGTMDAQYKAQDVLIKAVAICRSKGLDVKLKLMGAGRFMQKYIDTAADFCIGEHVEFLGLIKPGPAVREQLDKSDIFVFPSLTEGQGKALLEAMARAMPCVGSDVGGITELLEPKYLIEPGNAEALAAAIENVLCEREQISQIALRNLTEGRKYHVEILQQRRVQFHKKLIEVSKK